MVACSVYLYIAIFGANDCICRRVVVGLPYATRLPATSLAEAYGSRADAELRALLRRISIHALEYSLTISFLAEVRRRVFSIVLVGKSDRLIGTPDLWTLDADGATHFAWFWRGLRPVGWLW